jgi:hypothetical protein
MWVLVSFHYGSYVFVFAILGWAFGFALGSELSRWQLRVLSKNGEYKIGLKATGFLLIATIVALFVFCAFVSPAVLGAQLLLIYELVDFTSSSVAPIYAAQMILFSRWEKKHGRIIAKDGSWSTRMYVFPQSDKTPDTTMK